MMKDKFEDEMRESFAVVEILESSKDDGKQ